MKKFLTQAAFLFAVCYMLQSCVKDTLQTSYTYFTPVYKSKADVWQNIKSAPPQPLQQTGKLFLMGQYIFINEINKGVHIIDNANPLSPKNISFINIPGNIDIAVKDNILYADLHTDMVSVDISNPSNAVLKRVNKYVFPERDYYSGVTTDSGKYIIEWLRRTTSDKREFDKSKTLGQPLWQLTSANMSNALAASATIGIGGSMARFTVVNNFLYTVGRSDLTAFNISTAANPVMESTKTLGWNIETIYPLKDKLFIGSQTGMFIYSISNPASPTFLSNFTHACFNDPVIADDQYAYITLRATNESVCRGVAAQTNELDIVNITNILQPSLVRIYDMAGPKGLSKDGDHLFICDDKGGLKIFNVANVQDIKLLKVISNITPFDIICNGGLAIVVADEGIFQYDYKNINDVKLISKITVSKK